MKAVILAGDLGTRISEETHLKPKPMIEIGGRPILWHIMKIYSSHGVNDFIICCGYKGYVIKEYFANYFLHMSDVTFDMTSNQMEVHHKKAEPWRITLVDTGDDTLTGGRLKRVASYVRDEEAFCFTYGDGVADVHVAKQIAYHKHHGKLATVKGVLVTGAGGSIGSELCRQILAVGPARLLLLEQSEFVLYAIHQELLERLAGRDIELLPLLGSVQDAPRMQAILRRWKPHTVYHAAAHKHVPLVEHNPVEGVRNNVLGTLVTARAAAAQGVADFVLISTDKAVRPTNIMGASKRLTKQA